MYCYFHYSIFKHTNIAVVSLVNIAVAAAKDSERGADIMFHYLMESVQSIKWVGLGAQSYVMSTINGMKVGFIAVCVAHAECAQESVNYASLSPVKYQVNTFTSMVKKLHEVTIYHEYVYCCKPLSHTHSYIHCYSERFLYCYF